MNVNIYADEMLLLNFAANMAVILISGKILNKRTGILRKILISLIFSLISFIAVVSHYRIYINFLSITALNMLMAVLLFKPESIKSFIKYTAVIKISSLCINEAYLLICHYFGGRYKITFLALAMLMAYFSVIFLKNTIKSNTYYHSVAIVCNNKTVNTVGLVDTGNSLVEPISHKPVIIAEFNAVKDLLPDVLAGIYEKEGEASLMEIAEAIADDSFKRHIRLIPFKSIGSENGIMIGFVADCVNIDGNYIKKPVVAIYRQSLCKCGTYNTLLSPRHIGGV